MLLAEGQTIALMQEAGFFFEPADDAPVYTLVLSLSLDRVVSMVKLQAQIPGSAVDLKAVEMVDAMVGLHRYQMTNLAGDLNLPQEWWPLVASACERLYRLYLTYDAVRITMTLNLHQGGHMILQNAHIWLDDHAHYRQPLVPAPDMEYVTLTGRVAVVGNGTGMILSAMDALYASGQPAAQPACFLELDDEYLAEQLQRAAATIWQDGRYRVVVLVYFGNLVGCDEMITLLLQTASRQPLLPLVLLIDGQYREEAVAMWQASGKTGALFVESLVDIPAAVMRLLKESDDATFA